MPEHPEPRGPALFAAALEIADPIDRVEYLDRACGGEATLRREVDLLLAAHVRAEAGDFMGKRPPLLRAEVATALSAYREEQPGDRIDRYTLQEPIGEGGFGVVWMAEQQEPMRRRVALKVIKLGMDTKQVVARFEAERQALALMDHPNIARVFDGGVTGQGRPYFVMELIQGLPITDYCDRERLDPRQRLELFVQVCQGVQHAHQKGVIHRDLKPSNLLVAVHDNRPAPKIIDFGVAKALAQPLTEKTLATGVTQLVGTPAYMSPEQTLQSQIDIDTRSDVYALGVLLYELLTGRPPFSPEELLRAGLAEMHRVIRETDPPKPSTRYRTMHDALQVEVATRRRIQPKDLHRAVRGDLDWIVMKALEKDRTRRYETVNGLARDIQRHLADEPVTAAAPSWRYQLWKLARRHRIALGTWAAFSALLIVAVVVSLGQAFRATRLAEEAGTQHQLAANAAAHAAAAAEESEILRKRAEEAQRQTAEALQSLYLAQIEANRYSGRPGRRFDGLAAVAKAAAIAPSLQLRNQAIALLPLVDARLTAEWSPPEGFSHNGAFDLTGQRIVYSDKLGNLSLRRLGDTNELRRLPGHGRSAFVFRFSPRGRHLAVKYDSGGTPEMVLWDLATGRKVTHLAGAAIHVSLEFSEDGEWLGFGHADGSLVFLETETATPVQRVQTPWTPYNLRLTPDKRRVAVSSLLSRSVVVQQVADGRILERLPHPGVVRRLAWDKTGNRLATACSDGSVHVWTGGTNGHRVLQGHESAATAVAFSQQGHLLLSAGWDGTTRIWEPTTAAELLVLPGAAAGFGPNDRSLGCLRAKRFGVWELADGRQLVQTRWDGTPNSAEGSVVISPDLQFVASGASDGCHLFAARDGRYLGRIPADLASTRGSVLFTSNNSALIVSGRGGSQWWPLRTSATDPEIVELGPPRTLLAAKLVHSASLSDDGSRLLLCAGGENILVDLEGAVVMRQKDRRSATRLGALNRNGTVAALGTWQGEDVDLWRPSDGDVRTIRVGASAHPCFSPDAEWLLVSDGVTIRAWRAPFQQEAYAIESTRGNEIPQPICFSADGREFLTSTRDDSVQLYETSTGHELAAFPKETGSPSLGFAFGADRSLVAVWHPGNILRIWNLRTIRQELTALRLDWPAPPVPEPPAHRPAPRQIILHLD